MGKDFKTLYEGIVATKNSGNVEDRVRVIMYWVKGLTPEMVIQKIIEYNREEYPDMPDDADAAGFCENCENYETTNWTIIIDKTGREKCYECQNEFYCAGCSTILTSLDRKILRKEGFGNIQLEESEYGKRNKKITCAVCRQEASEGLPPNTLPRPP